MISSTPLFSSLYNSSTYSAHLSITLSFSIRTFPCLLLIVCNPLFPFGLSSLIFWYIIWLCALSNISISLHLSSQYLSLACRHSFRISCFSFLYCSSFLMFCTFFFPPSYAISLSSSSSVSLAASPSHKYPPQLSKYHLSNFSKFHLLPYIHQFFLPVVVDQAAFYMHF